MLALSRVHTGACQCFSVFSAPTAAPRCLTMRTVRACVRIRMRHGRPFREMPACLPCLQACLPACLSACLPASLPACLLSASAKFYIPHLIFYVPHLILYPPHQICYLPHMILSPPPFKKNLLCTTPDSQKDGGFNSTNSPCQGARDVQIGCPLPQVRFT